MYIQNGATAQVAMVHEVSEQSVCQPGTTDMHTLPGSVATLCLMREREAICASMMQLCCLSNLRCLTHDMLKLNPEVSSNFRPLKSQWTDHHVCMCV